MGLRRPQEGVWISLGSDLLFTSSAWLSCEDLTLEEQYRQQERVHGRGRHACRQRRPWEVVSGEFDASAVGPDHLSDSQMGKCMSELETDPDIATCSLTSKPRSAPAPPSFNWGRFGRKSNSCPIHTSFLCGFVHFVQHTPFCH